MSTAQVTPPSETNKKKSVQVMPSQAMPTYYSARRVGSPVRYNN